MLNVVIPYVKWSISVNAYWYLFNVGLLMEKTLESPLDCKRSNQSILKEINSEYSLEGLMLKLKLQSFSHLMRRVTHWKKTLMLGKTEGRRRRGRQRMKLSCSSVQFSRSVVSFCDPMDCGTPGLPVHHQLPELAQTHIH